MIEEKWQGVLDGLDERRLRIVIAYLLGRTGLTDEQFIARVKELLE